VHYKQNQATHQRSTENAAALFHQEEAKIVTFRMAADQPPSAPKICEYVAAVVTIHPTLRSGQTIRCHGGFGWDEQQALEGLHKVLAEKVAGVLHGCLCESERALDRAHGHC